MELGGCCVLACVYWGALSALCGRGDGLFAVFVLSDEKEAYPEGQGPSIRQDCAATSCLHVLLALADRCYFDKVCLEEQFPKSLDVLIVENMHVSRAGCLLFKRVAGSGAGHASEGCCVHALSKHAL